jgi:hypothetical protein
MVPLCVKDLEWLVHLVGGWRRCCIREEDELGASYSEPYIWPVLLSIESTQFGVTAPTK